MDTYVFFVRRAAIAFVILGSCLCASICLISLLVPGTRLSISASDNRLPAVVGAITFIGFALVGLYYATLKIEVGPQGLRVKSLFSDRQTRFEDIATVSDHSALRNRTLEVRSVTGRRVLNISSTGLPGYGQLVLLLEDRIRKPVK
jgi:hypothetical protein